MMKPKINKQFIQNTSKAEFLHMRMFLFD